MSHDLQRVMLDYNLTQEQLARWVDLMRLPIAQLPPGARALIRRERRKIGDRLSEGEVLAGALAEYVRRTTRHEPLA
jgi:hypothetical protein